MGIFIFIFSDYPDHLIVVPGNENDSVNFWTQKFVGLNNDDSMELGSYRITDGDTFQVNLMLDKRTNLNGKIFITGGVPSNPFYMCNKNV